MTRKQAIRILVYKVFPCLKNSEWGEALKMAIKALEQEPKQGHWIYDDDCHEHGHCSECGTKEDLVDGKIRYFCRVCGAKMDSEVNK